MQETHSRYIVRDVRERQNTDLRNKVRDPWQLIDTTTNRILDEFASKRAATLTARDMNRAEQSKEPK